MKRQQGFSLVELMIVVAIMAILAAIAIPSFMKFSQRAKTAEATQNLAAIRSCLESYRAENDRYLPSPAVAIADTPGARTGPGAATPIPWPDPAPGWDDIGFAPDGNVRYSYAVAGGNGGAGDITNTFMVTASGDIDEDGRAATYTVDTEAVDAAGAPTYPKPVLDPAGEL